MTSPAQTEANRQNALESTGPRTPEGKARSSKNALRHGLLSREVLLPDEPAEDLEAFRTSLHEAVQPEGELEELLFDRLAAAAWRLRRAAGVERQVFQDERRHWQNYKDMGLGYAFTHASVTGDAFSKLSRYEASLERSLFRSLHELQRLQAARLGQDVPLPAALDVDVAVSGPSPEALEV